MAQTERLFKTGFEFNSKLNDTGIKWAGEYPTGNNGDCSSSTISHLQDCHLGRDADPLTNSDADGHAGFSFTKLDTNGVPLVEQNVDYTTTPWVCVQDNVSGLVWEVKTITAGKHNKDNVYQWGGLTAIGRGHPDAEGAYYDDWNDLVQESNTEVLCGFDNWRMPTIVELVDLVNKGTFNPDTNPSIDINYFPNTEPEWFWSSSPTSFGGSSSYAWMVHYGYGNDSNGGRNGTYRVRLVRGL